ncbi:MFS transporter [Arthrobacter flavus]|uniref:MFS transporter n=1 Tax=Arthrobacter flavus TaxID=95172 RepID=A0ABW4Q7H3_9MICC
MRSRKVLLFACCLAQLIVVLDSSILTVALPQISTDLAMTTVDLPWIVNAFAIPIAGLLLLSGKLSDRYGAKPVLLAGTLIFTVASLLGGLAPDAGALISARIGQGVGAALISPATLMLLSTSFSTGSARARAFGLWGAASGSGGAIGVLAGGILVEGTSWRWTLLVNVPLGAGLVVLLLFFVAGIQPSRSRGRLDFAGAIAGTTAVTALALAFASLESPLLDVGPAVWIALAVIAAGLFILIELKWVSYPLLPLRRLSGKSLWVLPGAMFLIGGAMTGTFYFLTLYFQLHQGLAPLETGLAFLPLSAAAFIAAAATHPLSKKLGVLRAATLAVILMTAALGTMSGAAHAGSTVIIIMVSVLFGAGMGVAISTIADLVTASFPSEMTGIASGVLTTAQQTGNTIGLAALVSLDTGTGTGSTSHGTPLAGAAFMTFAAALCILNYSKKRRRNPQQPSLKVITYDR